MDVDVGIFSRKYQKFYFSNDATGNKFEITPQDPKANNLVCVPYDQYIDLTEGYVCKKKK